MVQAAPLENVQVHIQGDVTGQVAIGKNIVQIGSVHGGVINVAMPDEHPRIRPRLIPPLLLPRPFPDLLDRTTEIDSINTALRSNMPVEICGQEGIGKTVLLRHIAHAPLVSSFPDGIVHLSALHQPVADLLQFLFEAFYESSDNYKPTEMEIRHALQGKRALVLLDDVELTRDEVEILLNSAATCTFVLASSERHFWGEDCTVPLRGLPLDDALALVERELGQILTPAERPAARAICTALNGHPLSIRQSVALVHEGLTLSDVAQRVQTPAQAEKLVLASLSKSEQQVLAALAALGGASVHISHLITLSRVSDIQPVLDKLLLRGLVEADGARFSLNDMVCKTLEQVWDLTPWAERSVAYFITWTEKQKNAPDRLLEEADATHHLLAWAIGVGRWTDVVRLGRAMEGALALGKRWGVWAQVLQWVFQAAQALEDQTTQAWALHQDGTRAACLGNTVIGRTSLIKAVRLRESLGDWIGAAVTRHNLSFFLPPPPPTTKSPPPPIFSPPVVPLALGATAVLAVVLLTIGSLWSVSPPPTSVPTILPSPIITPTATNTVSPPPTPSPTVTPIPVSEATPTATPTVTATGTPTPSRTPTPTTTPCPCGVPPTDWIPYTVESEDSLYSLARARLPGTTVSLRQLVEQIAYYNCLCPGDRLRVGQRLYLPPLPTPTPTHTPTPTSTYTPTPTLTFTPTPNPPPVSPDSLNAVVDPSQIYLSWRDNASDESAYRIERREGNASWVEIDAVEADTTAYVDDGVCGITYYYRVRAYRASDGQYSDYSNVASAAWACPPLAPSNLNATQVTSQKRINLSWQDNASDESNYRIYRSPNGSTNWVQIYTTVSDNVTNYTDSGLDCYTSYYYRVRAYRASDGQYSDYSNPAFDTTVCFSPTAQILDPQDGEIIYIPYCASIPFEGEVSDPEDEISELIVEWSSDVDGFLGNGSSITNTLTCGSYSNPQPHTITLKVTDSDGNIVRAVITVAVWY